MPANRDAILVIVLETLRELGEDLNLPELTKANDATRLFGARSALDSMNLVNLIADVEERISDDLGVDITLANQRAMSRTHSPFRHVSSCVDYIVELINAAEA
jgi:acyl carrier protein